MRARTVDSIGLFLFSTLACLMGASTISLWSDEAATISAATRSFGELWRMLFNIDAVHGLYYIGMHFWVEIFGISPVALRLPSALVTGLGTVGVYVLANKLGDRRLGVISGFLFAILPRVTWMGVEARPYAFTATVSIWATVVLITATTGESRRWWVLYSSLAAVGIAFNIYVAFLVVGHGLTLFYMKQTSAKLRRRWLISGGFSLALGAPIVLEAMTQTAQLGDNRLSWLQLGREIVVSQWFLGDTPTLTTGANSTGQAHSWLSSWWEPASIALALTCWALTIWGAWSGWKEPPPKPSTDSGQHSGWRPAPALAWTLPWMALPTVVIGLYSVLVHPMYTPRYLSFATPAFAVLLAWGVTRLRCPRYASVSLILILVLTVPVYASQRDRYSKNGSDWSDVAAFIELHKVPGDAIYFAPRFPITGPTVRQTTRGALTSYPESFSGLSDVTLIVTPDQANTLTGQSRLLSSALPDLKNFNTLWVLRRNDYTSSEQDDAALTAVGFTAALHWTGPLDTVIQFVKA